MNKEKKYNIRGIDFRYSIGLNLKTMERIIKGIAKNPSFVKNLKFVWIDHWKLEVSKVQMLFIKNGIDVTLDYYI